MSRPRGFTLIELLVVISIISLLSSVVLASLNTARAKARDARRQLELSQLDKAVAGFFNANGYLPRNSSGWCTYISHPTYIGGIQSDFIPVYLPALPSDPQFGGQPGDYLYRNTDNLNGKYTLCAKLEKNTGLIYDYTTCAGAGIYNYCIQRE